MRQYIQVMRIFGFGGAWADFIVDKLLRNFEHTMMIPMQEEGMEFVWADHRVYYV